MGFSDPGVVGRVEGGAKLCVLSCFFFLTFMGLRRLTCHIIKKEAGNCCCSHEETGPLRRSGLFWTWPGATPRLEVQLHTLQVEQGAAFMHSACLPTTGQVSGLMGYQAPSWAPSFFTIVFGLFRMRQNSNETLSPA